ncbi:MAG: DUF2877 domain-containing protein [Syntrophomonas sp.]|nr:DUF2877 domain-containing protein [Syntrophomonas sp.]
MFCSHLKAISIGPLAIRRQNGYIPNGKIHSVFRRVVNISWPDGSLSSISRVDISNSPANIVTNLPVSSNFRHYSMVPGTSVHIDMAFKTLFIGNVSISLKDAIPWQSPLTNLRSLITPGHVKLNLEKAVRWVNLQGLNKYGLRQLFTCLDLLRNGTYLPSAHSDLVTYLAGQAINRLLPALYRTDRTIIRDSVASLIGLGPGLTPSGDDYLAGLLLSLTACSRLLPATLRSAQMELVNTVVELTPALTNDISQQMLILAAKGTGSELMENMVVALFGAVQTQNSVTQAASNLSAVGASSGFDQLLGIMSGAILYSD